MSLFWEKEALAFNLILESPFFFTCMRCCSCCYHRCIELNSYEIFRLAQYLRLSVRELEAQYLNRGPRPWLRNKSDGACLFLQPSGCSVHPARPLVCRLYPLGLLFGPGSEERWGVMPLHPECPGLITNDKKLEVYLQEQGVYPYLRFERLLPKSIPLNSFT